MSWINKLLRQAPAVADPPPVSIMALVDHERESYRSALVKLHAELRSLKREVFPEVQIKFGSEDLPEPYRLMRLDAFYKDGENVGPAEANINNPWKFTSLSENWSGLHVTAYPLVWNSVEFKVSGPIPDHKLVFAWLTKWYDPSDTRLAGADGLYNVVHNVTLPEQSADGWNISVDFGSGPLDAFTEFIELLMSSGASKVEIGSISYGPANPA